MACGAKLRGNATETETETRSHDDHMDGGPTATDREQRQSDGWARFPFQCVVSSSRNVGGMLGNIKLKESGEKG